MVFIAHVINYNTDNGEKEKVNVALIAPTFAEAAEQLEKFFGQELQSIELLEPITDGEIIVLNPEAEKNIREEPCNSW